MVKLLLPLLCCCLCVAFIHTSLQDEWTKATHKGTGITLEYPSSWWDEPVSFTTDSVLSFSKTHVEEGPWGEEEKINEAGFEVRRYNIGKTTPLREFVDKKIKELSADPAYSQLEHGRPVLNDFSLEIDGDKALAIHFGAEGEDYQGFLFHGFYRPVRIFMVREGYAYEFRVFAHHSVDKTTFLPVFERMIASVKIPWK